MVRINLSRILSKSEVKEQINNILYMDSSPILICDLDERLIFGDDEARNLSKYPIANDNISFGWVYGKKNAKVISSILSYICFTEIEKRTLGQETLEKYKEISVLYDVTEKLAGRLEPKTVASFIVSEAKRLIKADNVSVMFYNEEKDVFELSSAEDCSTGNYLTIKKGEGIAGCVALTGKAEIINNVSKDPRFIKGKTEINSMMCAPLIVRDRLIGVINLSSIEHHNYSANDLKILSALAFQASISVENARLYDSLKEAFITIVHTLAETIEKRDPYTGGHTKRVMDYSIAIGEILGLPEEELERLKLGAVLHDIGKIGIRDDILLKKAKLTEEEFKKIQQHTVYGHEILKHVAYLHNIIPAIRHHHERYDGKGYPDQINGGATDIIARIISVADTYDAMTSDRPYRKSLSHETAFEEIKRNSGLQFDPSVVKAFEAACNSGKIKNGDEKNCLKF